MSWCGLCWSETLSLAVSWDLCCWLVLVEQSSEALPALDPVRSSRQRDHVRVIIGRAQPDAVALVASAGVVVLDVSLEHIAKVAVTASLAVSVQGSWGYATLPGGPRQRARDI